MRFTRCAKTPLPCALPAHFLYALGGLSSFWQTEENAEDQVRLEERLLLTAQDILSPLCSECEGGIACMEPAALEKVSRSFQKICVLHTARNAGLHKVRVGAPRSFAELILMGSTLPFTVGAGGSTLLDPSDLDLFIRSARNEEERLDYIRCGEEDVAGIWLERTEGGSYVLCRSFHPNLYLARFLSSGGEILHLPWQFDLKDPPTIHLLSVAKTGNFDASEARVVPSSVYRGRYWTFQLRFLLRIHERWPDLPLVFVTDVLEADEKEALINLPQGVGPAPSPGLQGQVEAWRKGQPCAHEPQGMHF